MIDDCVSLSYATLVVNTLYAVVTVGLGTISAAVVALQQRYHCGRAGVEYAIEYPGYRTNGILRYLVWNVVHRDDSFLDAFCPPVVLREWGTKKALIG